MKTVSYHPARDELVLTLGARRNGRSRRAGRFLLRWDREGNLTGLTISSFTQELEEFERNRRTVRLGGLWKGVRVGEEDLREARKNLLRRREASWD